MNKKYKIIEYIKNDEFFRDNLIEIVSEKEDYINYLDQNFYTPDSFEELLDSDLKQNGIESSLLSLAAKWKNAYFDNIKNKYIWPNEYLSEFEIFSEAQAVEQYLDENLSEEEILELANEVVNEYDVYTPDDIASLLKEIREKEEENA